MARWLYATEMQQGWEGQDCLPIVLASERICVRRRKTRHEQLEIFLDVSDVKKYLYYGCVSADTHGHKLGSVNSRVQEVSTATAPIVHDK